MAGGSGSGNGRGSRLWRMAVAVAILFISGRLLAQAEFTPSTYIGINGGLNLCRVGFIPSVNQKFLTTASSGLVLRHISERNIGTQIELNYAGRGWIEDLDSAGTYRRNMQVLDIPLTAAFIAGQRKFRVAFSLGPYLDRLMDQKETIRVSDTLEYHAYFGKKLDINWEFGLTGGIAFEYYTRLGTFGLRAVYSHALSNLFPLNKGEYYYGGSRSQTIHAGITYFIKL